MFSLLSKQDGTWKNLGTHSSLDEAMDVAGVPPPWEPYGIREAGDGKAAYWRTNSYQGVSAQFLILREPECPSAALLTTRYRLLYSILAGTYNERVSDYTKIVGERVARLRKIFPQHRSVLDIGCGTGQALYTLDKAGYTATGAEVSLAMAQSALEHSPHTAIINSSFTALAHGPFDLVWDSAVFHLYHSSQAETILGSFRRLLSPQGALSISTTLSAVASEGWEAKSDYPLGLRRYRRHFTKESLYQTLESYEFSVVDEMLGETAGKRWIALTAVPRTHARETVSLRERERKFN